MLLADMLSVVKSTSDCKNLKMEIIHKMVFLDDFRVDCRMLFILQNYVIKTDRKRVFSTHSSITYLGKNGI